MTQLPHSRIGTITLYCGPMFSGKSEELVQDIRRRRKHGQKIVQVFYPDADTRTDKGFCTSKSGLKEPGREFSSVAMLKELIWRESQVIAIDEVQFVSPDVVNLAVDLRKSGKDVVLAGLDFDFRGKPFDTVSLAGNVADIIDRRHAWCTECGELARWSQLLDAIPSNGSNIVIGDADKYAARCFDHFIRQH